jgi:hypothetical protein
MFGVSQIFRQVSKFLALMKMRRAFSLEIKYLRLRLRHCDVARFLME